MRKILLFPTPSQNPTDQPLKEKSVSDTQTRPQAPCEMSFYQMAMEMSAIIRLWNRDNRKEMTPLLCGSFQSISAALHQPCASIADYGFMIISLKVSDICDVNNFLHRKIFHSSDRDEFFPSHNMRLVIIFYKNPEIYRYKINLINECRGKTMEKILLKTTRRSTSIFLHNNGKLIVCLFLEI